MTAKAIFTAFGSLMLAAVVIAAFPADRAAASGCFFSRQFESWRGSPDAKTIYIRVAGRRYYRLDLAAPCRTMNSPGAFLVTKFHSSLVCHALDWDLHVASSRHDIPVMCMVKKMTELSPAEAAALPKASRP